MKKPIVIAVFLLMAPVSLSAQEEGLVEKTQPLAPRLNVSTFDSTAPEFSRDHLSKWSKAWGEPASAVTSRAAQSSSQSQSQGATVRKRRKWPYYVSGAAVFAVGVGLTAAYRGPCRLNCTWYCAVTCSPYSSPWVLGGGIAMMGGGGTLLIYGATR